MANKKVGKSDPVERSDPGVAGIDIDIEKCKLSMQVLDLSLIHI